MARALTRTGFPLHLPCGNNTLNGALAVVTSRWSTRLPVDGANRVGLTPAGQISPDI